MEHALRQTRGKYLCHISDCSALTNKSEAFSPSYPPKKIFPCFRQKVNVFFWGGGRTKTTFWAHKFNLDATEPAVRLHVPSPHPPRTLQLIHTPSPIKIPLSSVHSLQPFLLQHFASIRMPEGCPNSKRKCLAVSEPTDPLAVGTCNIWSRCSSVSEITQYKIFVVKTSNIYTNTLTLR